MNKKQAAEYLSVSERAIERYTAKGKLHVTYEKGRTGTLAIYDETELKTLKAEMQNPTTPTRQANSDSSDKIMRVTSSGLALAQAIGQAIGEQFPKPNGHVPIESKLTLTLKEAASLSGLSRSWLVGAIHAKKLKAAKRGRGWNIKRCDLDTYVEKLA